MLPVTNNTERVKVEEVGQQVIIYQLYLASATTGKMACLWTGVQFVHHN